MRYTTIVVAAFLALASGITGAPIDARTTRPKPKTPTIIVVGSGNGGDGGSNFALPIAISGASSKSWGYVKNGKVITESSSTNVVEQSANGGDGSAVGSYGEHNTFNSRSRTPSINVAPVVDPSIIILSGNGGAGGLNLGVPIAISGAKSDTGTVKNGGKVTTGSAAGNGVSQSANGGAGSAVGSYGKNNWFGARDEEEFEERGIEFEEFEERGEDLEARTYRAPKAPSIVIYGSGNGGDGGQNFAIPVAVSGAKSDTGTVKNHGTVKTGSIAVNGVKQSADGGSGSAVGSYGSDNHFGAEKRTNYRAPKTPTVIIYGSGNGGDGGKNIAVPIAVSGAKSDTGSVKWGGKVTSESAAGNGVAQSANGGDGSAVGSYGNNNHFGGGSAEKRTTYKPPKTPYIAVVNSGNGGDGGKNFAIPIAVSGAKSDTGSVKNGGKVKTDSTAENLVLQSANGGDGSAVGSYGNGNTFAS